MASRAADDRNGNSACQRGMKAVLGKVSTTRAKTDVHVRNGSDGGSSAAKVGDADCANVGSPAHCKRTIDADWTARTRERFGHGDGGYLGRE